MGSEIEELRYMRRGKGGSVVNLEVLRIALVLCSLTSFLTFYIIIANILIIESWLAQSAPDDCGSADQWLLKERSCPRYLIPVSRTTLDWCQKQYLQCESMKRNSVKWHRNLSHLKCYHAIIALPMASFLLYS